MGGQTGAGQSGMSEQRLAELEHNSTKRCTCGASGCFLVGLTPSEGREVLAEARRARAELAKVRAQMGETRDAETRAVDAALTAWAISDSAKLSSALLGLREVFIDSIAEQRVRDRHAAEDAQRAAREVGGGK